MTKRKYKQGHVIDSIGYLNIVIKVNKMFDLPIYLRDRAISPKWFENMTLNTLNCMIKRKSIREAIKL
ncbi:unnamed protein product [marine sediment metagenome]|uniref:Uncharacterized protein n=1 Tax=marine sediment metagenome TaxID=412755 RepID=X0VRX4_9ZZZZ